MRKSGTLTAITTTAATCRSTCSAAGICWRPNCVGRHRRQRRQRGGGGADCRPQPPALAHGAHSAACRFGLCPRGADGVVREQRRRFSGLAGSSRVHLWIKEMPVKASCYWVSFAELTGEHSESGTCRITLQGGRTLWRPSSGRKVQAAQHEPFVSAEQREVISGRVTGQSGLEARELLAGRRRKTERVRRPERRPVRWFIRRLGMAH